MKRNALTIVSLFLFIGFFSGLALAGQVVTKELSQWARQAIANEQTLSVIPSAKSVAVLYYQNLTGNAALDPLQKGLTVMLTTDLAKVKDIAVVERARLQAILDEIELGTTGLVDTETAPRVGRLVGARFLSSGDILKGSVTQLKLDPNLLDVPEQITINHGSAEGDLNELIAIEKEILFDIIRVMDVTLTPDQKAELEKPISMSIPALLLLFKGIDASDHGNYKQAADLYTQALAKDPNLTPAQEALNEINTLGLKSKEPTLKKSETIKTQKPSPNPKPTVTSAKSGGFLKSSAIVLGLAVAGAGGYYVATGDSDDDEPSPNPPPSSPTPPPSSPNPPPSTPTPPPSSDPDPSDTTPPTITNRTPDFLGCSGSGSMKFFFSEPINTNLYEVTYFPTSWGVTDMRWEGATPNTVLVIYTTNSFSYCNTMEGEFGGGGELTFTFTNFYDMAGNPLPASDTVQPWTIFWD